MGYAETQDEIIRAQLRGQSRAFVRVVDVAAMSDLRAPTMARAASAAMAREVAAPGADERTDADLAAAITEAHRLRFATEVEQIASAAGVTVGQLRGRGRERELVEARRIVAAYLRGRGCSLPKIGRILNRDHTTVLQMLRRHGGHQERVA